MMLSNNQVAQLPNHVSSFLDNQPTKEAEIAGYLSQYQGRLSGIARQISARDIIEFQTHLSRQIPLDEREEQLQGIISTLHEEYSSPLNELDPQLIFNLTPSLDLKHLL